MKEIAGKLVFDKNKLLLIVIVWVATLYIDFNYLLKFQISALKKTGSKISQLKKEIDSFDKELADLKNMQALAKAKPSQKLRRLISEEQIPLLLQKISDVAKNNNVVIMQIKPTREQQNNAAAKPSQPQNLAPIFINLDLISDYHSLGNFINGIENLEEFIAVGSFRIAREEKDYFKEKITLILKTYANK